MRISMLIKQSVVLMSNILENTSCGEEIPHNGFVRNRGTNKKAANAQMLHTISMVLQLAYDFKWFRPAHNRNVKTVPSQMPTLEYRSAAIVP